MKKPWHVYILRCSDNTLYTGSTNDIDKRLARHNSGKAAKYTRARLPVSVVYTEVQLDRSSALKRELHIKALSRKEKFLLIDSQKNMLNSKK